MGKLITFNFETFWKKPLLKSEDLKGSWSSFQTNAIIISELLLRSWDQKNFC